MKPSIFFGFLCVSTLIASSASAGSADISRETTKTQTAELRGANGTLLHTVQVTAFPNQPEVVIYDGTIFVENKPDFSFGSTELFYHLPEGIVQISSQANSDIN